MSSDVFSHGYIAALKKPPTLNQAEKLNEFGFDLGVGLSYDRSLLVIDLARRYGYRERQDIHRFLIGGDVMEGFQIGSKSWSVVGTPSLESLLVEFDQAASKKIPWHPAMKFSCIWYNGVDAPFNRLKVDDYLKAIGYTAPPDGLEKEVPQSDRELIAHLMNENARLSSELVVLKNAMRAIRKATEGHGL